MLASVLKYSDTGGRGVLVPRALPTSPPPVSLRRKKPSRSQAWQQQKHESHVVLTQESDRVNQQRRDGEGTVATYFNYSTKMTAMPGKGW